MCKDYPFFRSRKQKWRPKGRHQVLVEVGKNKAPRRKQRGINCAFSTCWLSASFRPKGRGIEPVEIKPWYALAILW